MSAGHRRYWGHCDEDDVTVVVEVGPDSGPEATLDHRDWEDAGLTCPVCGETVPGGWESAETTTTREAEDHYVKGAIERAYERHAEAVRSFDIRGDLASTWTAHTVTSGLRPNTPAYSNALLDKFVVVVAEQIIHGRETILRKATDAVAEIGQWKRAAREEEVPQNVMNIAREVALNAIARVKP